MRCPSPHHTGHFTAWAGACRVTITSGDVSLQANVAGGNHTRALYNMLLAMVITLLLLVFVAVLNYTVWKVRGRGGGAGGGGGGNVALLVE